MEMLFYYFSHKAVYSKLYGMRQPMIIPGHLPTAKEIYIPLTCHSLITWKRFMANTPHFYGQSVWWNNNNFSPLSTYLLQECPKMSSSRKHLLEILLKKHLCDFQQVFVCLFVFLKSYTLDNPCFHCGNVMGRSAIQHRQNFSPVQFWHAQEIDYGCA